MVVVVYWNGSGRKVVDIVGITVVDEVGDIVGITVVQ